MTKFNALVKGAPGALALVSPIAELLGSVIEQGRYRESEYTRREEIASRERLELTRLELDHDRLRQFIELHTGERRMTLASFHQLLAFSVQAGDREQTEALLRAIVEIVGSPVIPKGPGDGAQ